MQKAHVNYFSMSREKDQPSYQERRDVIIKNKE